MILVLSRLRWPLFGGVFMGIGWLAFVQCLVIAHAGNIADAGNMLELAPIYGAIAFAFLFSFRYARLKVALWRKLLLALLGGLIIVLAIIRIYRAFAVEDDVVATTILTLSWTIIGLLIGWYIGNTKNIDNLFRK
jgi:predicted membrane-bound spermidine synthase